MGSSILQRIKFSALKQALTADALICELPLLTSHFKHLTLTLNSRIETTKLNLAAYRFYAEGGDARTRLRNVENP